MKRALGIFVIALVMALAPSAAWAEVTTIFEIQMGSFEEGDEVTVESVVVTGSGRFGFFIQELEPHPTWGWMNSGIWVYTNGSHLGNVQRGDLVNVTGAYEEYYDFSEIDVFHSPPCGETITCTYEVIGTETVPDPVLVLINEVHTGGPYAEAYESVLIRVDTADDELWAGAADQHDEWYIYTDGVGAGDSLLVDSYSSDPQGDFDYPLPEEGDMLTFLQGILTYSYGNFKLAPRNCPEDMGMPCPPILRGVWAYDNNQVDVYFAVDVDEASAENIDNYEFDSGLEVFDAQRDEDNHRIVHLTTEQQSSGSVDIAYVSGVLSEGDLVPMPDGEFTFTQGITPIYDIQYVDDPLEDDSPYLDIVVTTTGRVAHVEGNYYYLQQGDAGEFKHLYGRVARTGDLAVGDSVKFAGVVREYYGATYVNFIAGVILYERLGEASGPVIVTDVTADQIIYDADAGDNSPPDDNAPEPWEDALIRLEPARADTVAGQSQYGEYWLIVAADSCRTDFNNRVNNYGAGINYRPHPGDSLRITGILRYEYEIYHIVPRNWDDIEILYSTGVDDFPPEAVRVMLDQNSPNPFGLSTAISFRLETGAKSVGVEIFDVSGARVRNLIPGLALPPGTHAVHWDGTDDSGLPMTSGTYFYRLTVDGRSEAKQMIRLK